MPTTYVIIRHANDKVKSVHKQDPPISSRGRKEARNLAKKLIKKYGQPFEVRISPFRRTRETYESFSLENFDRVFVDVRLSRYFSEKEKRNPKVSDDTFHYDIPMDPDIKSFKMRVRSCAKSLKAGDGDKTIWILTHALVFKELADYFDISIDDKVDFLQTMIVKL